MDGPQPSEALRREWGIRFGDVRQVIAALEKGGTIGEIVAASGVPRESVKAVVRTLRPWVEERERNFRLTTTGLLPSRSPRPAESELMERIQSVNQRPTRRRHLDHVEATPETLVARARFLDDTWELDDAHVVFLGDRDLTSMALGHARTTSKRTVADIDPDVLKQVSQHGAHTRYADLRLGLPPTLAGQADLVFIDPPYTPAGIETFLRRSIEALADKAHGRIVCCYGFGENHPGLGLKVQAVFTRLRLILDQVLPAFNHYSGAEALGSRSSLYVLRVSSHTPNPNRWTPHDPRIYSHGRSADESSREPQDIPPQIAQLEIESPVGFQGGPSLAAYLQEVRTGGKPPFSIPYAGRVAINLVPDYEQTLLPVLLGANATELIIHTNHAALCGLEDVISARWTLNRSGPLLFAQQAPVPDTPTGRTLRRVMDHPRALISNSWRNSLQLLDPDLTKNDAKGLVPPGWEMYLSEAAPHDLARLPTSITDSLAHLSLR